MIELVLFLVGVIGVTHIVVDSKIMQPVRDWFSEPFWPPILAIRYDADGKRQRLFWLKAQYLWSFVPFKDLQVVIEKFLKDHPISLVSSMIGCYQCAGFWCGLFCGLLLFPTTWGYALAAAGAGSFLSSLAATLLNYLEAGTIVHLEEKEKN